ncbi:MAG: mechanosensitive ion channel [Verrucomicrobia bacterium]|nr:mechanosensitive ion channel [Verrucomicrobiota bacterium]
MEKILTLSSAELIAVGIESILILIAAFALFFGLKRGLVVLSKRASLPTLALTPVRLVLRYGILILAGCLILSRFGINVNGILAVLATGVAMIAIGFVAVWSVLSNLLCTFVLIIFKPFSVGDDLEFSADQIGGKVVDLTLIFTTLRGKEGELYQIPNNLFFQKIFKCRPGNKAVGLDEQLQRVAPADSLVQVSAAGNR